MLYATFLSTSAFRCPLPSAHFGRHTSYIVNQILGDRRRRMHGVQTSQFDSIPPIRSGRPTFDLSVRSNFPPSSSSFSPRRHPRREQGNSSSQTNETNCISSEQERTEKKKEAKWNYETGYCSGGLRARPRQLTHMTLHRSLGGPKLNLRN